MEPTRLFIRVFLAGLAAGMLAVAISDRQPESLRAVAGPVLLCITAGGLTFLSRSKPANHFGTEIENIRLRSLIDALRILEQKRLDQIGAVRQIIYNAEQHVTKQIHAELDRGSYDDSSDSFPNPEIVPEAPVRWLSTPVMLEIAFCQGQIAARNGRSNFQNPYNPESESDLSANWYAGWRSVAQHYRCQEM
jgi:ribosome modulation factor